MCKIKRDIDGCKRIEVAGGICSKEWAKGRKE